MNDTSPRPSRVVPLLLAAVGVVLVALTAWKMYFPGEGFPERTESELAAIFARRAAPSGAEVTVGRTWEMTELTVRGVAQRRDQNALILSLARVQMDEEWRPIRIEFAPPEGDDAATPRVVLLQDGHLHD